VPSRAGAVGVNDVAALAPPPAAEEYFGTALPQVRRYAALLAGRGAERGLIGPREVPRLWDRHLLNCAVVHEAIPRHAAVADVGSGAGLPGVVIALIRTDLSVTLVEPLLRRATYLEEIVVELELSHVTVVRARAEELHGSLSVDVVTARAVASLDKLARWTLPLLRPGGRLLALKGESVIEEVAKARGALVRAGAVAVDVEEYGSGIVDPATRVAVIEAGPGTERIGARRR
jgi:16S rRNA (guanine527-N7)-methyltransferase